MIEKIEPLQLSCSSGSICGWKPPTVGETCGLPLYPLDATTKKRHLFKRAVRTTHRSPLQLAGVTDTNI